MTAPRLRFVRSLAVALDVEAARPLLEGLGAAHTRDADAWTLGDSAILVVTPTERTPRGFIPLFVTDDLQAAGSHYLAEGLQVRDLPWDPMARAILVGVDGGWICVAERAAVYDGRSSLLEDEPTVDENVD